MNRASPSGLYLASLALAEQEESVVRARSTLGALVAGIIGVGESQQADLLINIFNNLIIFWCIMGHLIDWQLRHQRDHINDNFVMEILVPDSDF